MAPKKGKTGKVVNPMFGKEDPPDRGKLTVDVGDDDDDDGGEPGVRPRSPSRSSSDAGEMTPKRAALKQRIAERQLAKYEEIFQQYDTDGSGTIDPTELTAVMSDIWPALYGHAAPREITAAEIADMVAQIDTDGSGEIDFEEFVEAITARVSDMLSTMNREIEDQIFGAQQRHVKKTAYNQLDEEADPKAFCGLLHPLSPRRKWYDIFQMALLMWTLYAIPMRIAFDYQPSIQSFSFWFDVAVDLAFLIDLFIQMHTYFLHGRTGLWVDNFTLVRARYFKTWFIVDFVAVFPADYLVRLLHWHDGGDARSLRMMRLARLLRYARLLKLLNLQRLRMLIEDYQQKIGFSAATFDFVVKLFVIVFGLYAFNHLVACLWIFIGREHSQFIEPYGVGDGWWDRQFGDRLVMGHKITENDQYTDAIYFIMMTVTSVGYGDITTGNIDEKNFLYYMMFVTAFVYAYIIGVFSDIVASRRSDRNTFDMKMRSVFEFLNYVDCPKALKADIKMFYDHRYPRKTLFDERMVYSELPPKFMKRLVLHRFEKTVHFVPFFRACSDECIVAICRKFVGFMATPGDYILERGEANKELVIMEHGEATGDDGAGITTEYEAGSFFGEMEFLGLQEVSGIAVKANTYCDLYALKLSDIKETIADYPGQPSPPKRTGRCLQPSYGVTDASVSV